MPTLLVRRFPFAGLLLAAIAGILFQELAGCRSSLLLALSLMLGAGVLLVKRSHQLILMLMVACCFATLHAWQWEESSAARVAKILNDVADDFSFEGVVISEVKLSAAGNASFVLRADKINLPGCSIFCNVPMLTHWEGVMPAYGDRLRFCAVATSPPCPRNPGEFDYAAWLTRQGIRTELKLDPSNPGEIISSNNGFFLMRWAIATRHRLESLLQLGIEDDPAVCEVIKGMMLGKKEDASQGGNDDFQLTGTVHLFSVSGLHVGMIAMIIWFFLKLLRMPRRLAVSITIPLLFFYVTMTGLHVGSLRAAIMAAIVLVGFLFYERPQILNSLAAAAFLLLAVDTNLLFSAGWQFSFSVVLAIVLLASPLQRWMNQHEQPDPFLPKKLISSAQYFFYDSWQHLSQLVGVSVAAWIGSLIPCVIYFHRISFSALGANLLAVPLAFVILCVDSMTLLVGFFSSWLAIVFNNANWLFAKILLLVVHGFAILPASSLYVGLPASGYPVVTIFDLPRAHGAVFQATGKTWLIDTGRAINAARTVVPFLQSSGVNELAGLVATEKDAPHLGGAAFLQTIYPVFPIFMAPGESRSTSLGRLLQQTASTQQQVKMLHAGDRIPFSSACWGEVLYTPESAGEESNFGNDDILILKIHLGLTSFLMIPKITPHVMEWLLSQYDEKTLQADILEMPLEEIMRSEKGKRFLLAISPRSLIAPSDPHNALFRKEGKSFFAAHGVRLFCQEQIGAVMIEAKSRGAEVRGFLNFQFKSSENNSF